MLFAILGYLKDVIDLICFFIPSHLSTLSLSLYQSIFLHSQNVFSQNYQFLNNGKVTTKSYSFFSLNVSNLSEILTNSPKRSLSFHPPGNMVFEKKTENNIFWQICNVNKVISNILPNFCKIINSKIERCCLISDKNYKFNIHVTQQFQHHRQIISIILKLTLIDIKFLLLEGYII